MKSKLKPATNEELFEAIIDLLARCRGLAAVAEKHGATKEEIAASVKHFRGKIATFATGYEAKDRARQGSAGGLLERLRETPLE